MSMQSGKSLVKHPFRGKRAVNETLESTQLWQKKENFILGRMNRSVIGETSEAIIPL